MLNKQICMYNLTQPSLQSNGVNPAMVTNQPQKQVIFSQPTISNPNTTNVKRTLKPETDMMALLKKKAKNEGKFKKPFLIPSGEDSTQTDGN